MNIEDLNESMSADEVIAHLNGESIYEYRAEKELRMRISEESKQYEGAPSSGWPPIKFNWDLSFEGQRFSLDGMKADEFLKYYPNGFLLGHINLQELDIKLCHYSRRDEGELWKVGAYDKLARLIVYLSENRRISPPLVKPLESGEVIFNGGHHRYAIAKELNIENIPIHIDPKHKKKMDSILNIEWKNI
ncbi:ParB/Srx family N-terminal domain-containing protein [Salinicola avicenniae]|uniref:ParB/Srx family N-terminal domain-containing protein n=1 Tax=Salinicola avicenniae TaxID=2916836 RepID=UPI0020741FB0|nr:MULTISPECIES: ParB/RepB/Spo0J family partition protein [unclassified Salinicola]